MGFKWSLNPYQGCAHGCHYCFARRYHHYLDLDAGEDFSGLIFVKLNVAEALRDHLSRPSWKYERVAIGTATDPYQPIEGKYRLTRKCLEVFRLKGSPISLVTKGTMVVRDIDVLAELSQRAGCTVCFSIPTLDHALSSRLEPGTPPPRKRLQAMERLVLAGVHAGVLLAPVVPGITDSLAGMTEVVRGAAEHGARFLAGNVLYLKDGTKQHFLGFLEREHPRLLKTYGSLYPGAFAPMRLKEGVQAQIAHLKSIYGLEERHEEPEAAGRPRQLQLALGDQPFPC
jgi:DNA repair photolyase